MSPRTVYYRQVASPIGELLLTSNGSALTGVHMEPHTVGADWRRDDALLGSAAEQLQSYFAGELREFDLTLTLDGTDFQRQVWEALRVIPFGTAISYSELARRIGKPTASRAVGAANGCNPIAIIVPCHRVIGADGTLTGYGGGLDRKRWLLRHEGVDLTIATVRERTATAAEPRLVFSAPAD
jgi:methylated-DNA-[protein]-cysteine S-methyltransferase